MGRNPEAFRRRSSAMTARVASDADLDDFWADQSDCESLEDPNFFLTDKLRPDGAEQIDDLRAQLTEQLRAEMIEQLWAEMTDKLRAEMTEQLRAEMTDKLQA